MSYVRTFFRREHGAFIDIFFNLIDKTRTIKKDRRIGEKGVSGIGIETIIIDRLYKILLLHSN